VKRPRLDLSRSIDDDRRRKKTNGGDEINNIIIDNVAAASTVLLLYNILISYHINSTKQMTEPDELYTLRAQYALGHFSMAVQEAKQVARRPMSAALKLEREEYLNRAYAALHQYDKCEAAPGDDLGASSIILLL